jgi:hypothetical protein
MVEILGTDCTHGLIQLVLFWLWILPLYFGVVLYQVLLPIPSSKLNSVIGVGTKINSHV